MIHWHTAALIHAGPQTTTNEKGLESRFFPAGAELSEEKFDWSFDGRMTFVFGTPLKKHA